MTMTYHGIRNIMGFTQLHGDCKFFSLIIVLQQAQLRVLNNTKKASAMPQEKNMFEAQTNHHEPFACSCLLECSIKW